MKKIGIIDSGIGGLTILKEMMSIGLEAEFYYISDEENVPYGGKSQEFMLKRMSSMTRKLERIGVSGILIACNTATSETIDKLRSEFNIPFVGIEPYIKYLTNNPEELNSKVALILTQATFNSERFQELVKKFDPNNLIDIYPLPNLALLIESLKYKDFLLLEDRIYTELSHLIHKKYTHVILGCTHYPIISNYIEEKFTIKCVNPSLFVIKQVQKVFSLEVVSKNHDYSFFYNFNNQDDWKNISLLDMKFLYLRAET